MTLKATSTSTPKQTKLQELEAKNAALQAELEALKAAKPSGRVHNGELIVSEAEVKKMSASDFWSVADILVARDANGKKVTAISKKGNPYNTVVKGADYAWYSYCNSFAVTLHGGRNREPQPLSDKQVQAARGILSDIVRAGFLKVE